MSRYARSESTAYLSDRHVNLIEGADLVIRIGDPPDWRPTSERSADAVPHQLALARSDNQSPIATPPNAFSKVQTFVDFLAECLHLSLSGGSGASVDHERPRHQL